MASEDEIKDDLNNGNNKPVNETNVETNKKWRDLSTAGKVKTVLLGYVLKIVGLFIFLYFFICSLGLLGDSFQLVGGKAAGQVFKENEVLQNPVAGLMIGVLVTVLLQSSSTTTSIIVGLVAGGVIPVAKAIPMVMGANIGTSMTNTIVSLGQSGNREEFERAFAGATIHDMFNWLSVMIFLPLEIATGFFEWISFEEVEWISGSSGNSSDIKLLKVITDPFTKLIIQLDKDKIKELGTTNLTNDEIGSLIAKCDASDQCSFGDSSFHLFAHTDWSDGAVGALLLLVSLTMLIGCLVLLVKVLNSLLSGQVAKIIKKSVNSDLPGVFKYLTGYLVMLVGTAMTILVQSSSVFTSTLTPLVGIGILKLERMYPLTLGSNLGTTFTSILAALSARADVLHDTLQIAFVHLTFNICGILVFYPAPFMRKLPIGLARILGRKTAKYRWFAGLYLLMMFFLLPLIVFSLTLAGDIFIFVVGGIFIVFFGIIILINILQVKAPRILPAVLKTWEFLPKPLHSLSPYHNVVTSVCILGGRVCPCCRKTCDNCASRPRGDTVVPVDAETPYTIELTAQNDPPANEHSQL